MSAELIAAALPSHAHWLQRPPSPAAETNASDPAFENLVADAGSAAQSAPDGAANTQHSEKPSSANPTKSEPAAVVDPQTPNELALLAAAAMTQAPAPAPAASAHAAQPEAQSEQEAQKQGQTQTPAKTQTQAPAQTKAQRAAQDASSIASSPTPQSAATVASEQSTQAALDSLAALDAESAPAQSAQTASPKPATAPLNLAGVAVQLRTHLAVADLGQAPAAWQSALAASVDATSAKALGATLSAAPAANFASMAEAPAQTWASRATQRLAGGVNAAHRPASPSPTPMTFAAAATPLRFAAATPPTPLPRSAPSRSAPQAQSATAAAAQAPTPQKLATLPTREVATSAFSAVSLAASPKSPPKPAASQSVDDSTTRRMPSQAASTAAAPQTAFVPQSSATTPVAATSSLGLALASPAGLSSDVTPIADLATRLQQEAASLTPAETQAGRSPVKELELQLEPSDLGKVAVRLRMAGGKLAVDIGVANVNALAAVQSQGDQLAQRLQSSGQPLDSFVIRQQSQAEQDLSNGSMQGTFSNAASEGGESSNARDRQPRRDPQPAPMVVDIADVASADYLV